jgi:hypothetical protein
MNRTLILTGVVLIAVGLAWPWIARLGLGRLPGDFIWHKGNTSFYFPIVTCVVASIAISVVLWIFRK